MHNIWVVVPILSNDFDLTNIVDKLSGWYIAPDTFEVENILEDGSIGNENIPHPYAGQAGPNFSNKIVFINSIDNYKKYDGVVHIECFEEINISKFINIGIDYAISNGATHVFVLSTPANFDPFIISESILNCPDTELINISDGTAFILSSSSSLRIDESFRLWFWDNDFYRIAEDVCKSYRSEYSKFNTMFNLNINDPEINQIITNDEINFKLKWN